MVNSRFYSSKSTCKPEGNSTQMLIVRVRCIITHKLSRVTFLSIAFSANSIYLQVKTSGSRTEAEASRSVLQFGNHHRFWSVCLLWSCLLMALSMLWGVRCNVEIRLDQTAINARSLPGSTTVNNRWVSISWMSNQSWGCVQFNALSREVYGFLFWRVNVANNGESHAFVIKSSWYFIRRDILVWHKINGQISKIGHFFFIDILTPDCLLHSISEISSAEM